MFPGGAFWSPFNFCKSNIDELLSKENLKIEDILDDEFILSDLKNNNEKFGKFLHRHPHFIKSLVDYIIIEPNEGESDYKICYKYPFISSEILACEIMGLIKAFFEEADADSHLSLSKNFDQVSQESGLKEQDKELGEGSEEKEGVAHKKNSEILVKEEIAHLNISNDKNENEMVGPELLDYLLSFLEKKEKYLNQTLAGYFQKAINAILNKRGFDMLNYLFDKFDFIKLMIYHCINKSVIDILLRVLIIDIPFIDTKMTLFLEKRKEVMTLLLDVLDKTKDDEEAENISFLFCDLISKNKNVNSGKELIESLNTPQTLNILINKLFCENASIISSVCSILLNLVTFFMNKDTGESSLSESTKSPMKDFKPPTIITVETEYHSFFALIESHLGMLLHCINHDNLIPEFISTFGQVIHPFGSYRLKILEIISLLMKIGKPFNFHQIFAKNKIISTLMDMSLKYEFNSFLHSLCEKIIVTAMETEIDELIHSILVDCSLPTILREGMSKNELKISEGSRPVERGYKAFFIKISNFLVKFSATNQKSYELLKADEKWENFVKSELENINTIQNKDLGGHNPKKPNQVEEDENYKIEIDIKKIYEKFSQYFQNGPVKEKKDDFENEIEDDFEKESPEYGSPEKKQDEDEDDEIPEVIDHEIKEKIQTNSNYMAAVIQAQKEFNSSIYWKTEPAYKLEDLLKEM